MKNTILNKNNRPSFKTTLNVKAQTNLKGNTALNTTQESSIMTEALGLSVEKIRSFM